ncbi:MAG: imidazole glycerol phosphate synthase subunit HisH [Candidatus Methanofastidiosia archaeon]
MIGIIDYGAGNIASVKNAFEYLGYRCTIVDSPEEFDLCDGLVFPGVGSFGSMVENLEKKDIFYPLFDRIEEGKPYLGICLGLHILFESSAESPDTQGFALLKGSAEKFSRGKVPQIGWNLVNPSIQDIKKGWAYYVNSFKITKSEYAIATSDYFGEFVAAVKKNNITAFQFHPEKSGPYGLSLLKWWIKCLQKE